MPSVRKPRAGSMQYWPRKRCKRAYARIRHSPNVKEPGLIAFAGYKVGMTHVQGTETRKHSHIKGEEVSVPVTILECPALKIASIKFYKKTEKGYNVEKEIFVGKDKDLARKLSISTKKTGDISKINPQEYKDIKVLVYTQPKNTGTDKKKPEVFELPLGGDVVQKFNYAKDNVEKEIFLTSIFKEGDFVDLKSVTKGKGFQGPVKRFGISLRQSKSEKSIRNPGSLGPWKAQGHIMYRVSHAGKMGFHLRTELNKQIIKIVNDPKEITPNGGLLRYGKIKSPCVLIKGSIGGSKKRLIILQKPMRQHKQTEIPTLNEISLSSKQGN